MYDEYDYLDDNFEDDRECPLLQEMDPEYLSWLKENNISYDVDNPIKIKKG